jgi:hypothetical protein
MDHIESPDWETSLGCFDTYSLEVTSIFSKAHTDEPATLESGKSIIAWMTMIHEWTHFMQFCSTTYGLFSTINRMSQQAALTKLCHSIVKLMKARGDVPLLRIPIRKAINRRAYPAYLEPALDEFMSEWSVAEMKLRSNLGYWTTASGELVCQTLTPRLLARLDKTKIYAQERLTVGHIVEPIAIGCAGQWFIQEFGFEAYQAELPKLIPLGLVYTLLPAIERELGINQSTRMILHDLALMLPVEDRATGKKPTPQRYSPPSRLVAALELIACGEVEQVPDSEPSSYLKLAAELGKRLEWIDYQLLVRKACDLVASFPSGGPRPGLPGLFEDFSRAFKVRIAHPDAFVCLTEPSVALYKSGWQPAWKQSEGWLFHDSQSRDEADFRRLLTLAAQFVKVIVEGDDWECPYVGQCGNAGLGDLKFPFVGPSANSCPCLEAMELATGGALEIEQITFA